MINPKVSIIIPTFNRAEYLPQAIESALAQDYPNLEVVVSDNASTDETPEVIKKYLEDPRFKYFRNTKNLGAAGNWRKALYNYSTGGWVLILSDDDYLIDSSYISKAVGLINQYQDISLVHANYIIKYEDLGKIIRSNFNLPKFIDGKEYFLHYRERNFPHIHSTLTCLFSKAKALEAEAFSKDIYSLDTSLWLRLMLEGNVGFIEDHVAIYRVHQANESFNIDVNNDLDVLNDFEDIYRLAMNKNYFQEKDLDNWIERQVDSIFLWRFTIYLEMRKRRMAWSLFREYYRRYPGIMKVFVNPKNVLVFALVNNRDLLTILRKMKNYWLKLLKCRRCNL